MYRAFAVLKRSMDRFTADLIEFFNSGDNMPVVKGADRYTYRSYELRRRHMMSRFFKGLRLIYFVFCLLFFLAVYSYRYESWTTAFVLGLISVGYVLLRHFISSDQDQDDRQRSFYLDLFDYLLIGIAVYLTGGVKSFFIGAFILPIMATTLRFNIKAGLIGFGLTISIIGFIALISPDSSYYPPLHYLLFTLGTMIITIFSISRLVGGELKLSAEIYHNSVTDPLTGLFHSGFIRERIREEVAFSKRYKKRFSIVFLDLDRFKEINDHYGHLVGDGVLRHIAFVLQSVARRGETLARYAGDEFLLLLPGTGAIEARKTLQRLLRAVESQPYYLENGVPLWVSASGGTAEYPGDGRSTEQLLQVADENMYRTKQRQKGGGIS